jgi:hypothetical protein
MLTSIDRLWGMRPRLRMFTSRDRLWGIRAGLPTLTSIDRLWGMLPRFRIWLREIDCGDTCWTSNANFDRSIVVNAGRTFDINFDGPTLF